MQKQTVIVAGIALVAVAVVGGVWALKFVLGDSEPLTGPMTAIPVVVSTSAPAASVPTQAGESAPTAGQYKPGIRPGRLSDFSGSIRSALLNP